MLGKHQQQNQRRAVLTPTTTHESHVSEHPHPYLINLDVRLGPVLYLPHLFVHETPAGVHPLHLAGAVALLQPHRIPVCYAPLRTGTSRPIRWITRQKREHKDGASSTGGGRGGCFRETTNRGRTQDKTKGIQLRATCALGSGKGKRREGTLDEYSLKKVENPSLDLRGAGVKTTNRSARSGDYANKKVPGKFEGNHQNKSVSIEILPRMKSDASLRGLECQNDEVFVYEPVSMPGHTPKICTKSKQPRKCLKALKVVTSLSLHYHVKIAPRAMPGSKILENPISSKQ